MAKAELWVHYKPSLFQHIGTHSSLKGKVQKLKVNRRNNCFLNSSAYFERTRYYKSDIQDKQFGKITLYYAHENPQATVETRIKPYKQYTLQKAYKGESFFWGLLPQPGDHLKFKFSHPIFIKRYSIFTRRFKRHVNTDIAFIVSFLVGTGIYLEVEILNTRLTGFTTRQWKYFRSYPRPSIEIVTILPKMAILL